MHRIINSITRILAIALVAFSLVAVSSPAYALFEHAKDQACNGATQTESGCASNNKDADVEGTLSKVLNLLSFVVGVMAVIMLIIGGVKFITSQGDSGAVTGARNTILYALVGLVVVAFAQFIVKFVLVRVTA